MAVSTKSSFGFSDDLVLRWALKAFLLGLFLGAVAAISALA